MSDIGITISNGQGATIIMTGPAVTVNEGALGGDLSMPGFLLQQGAIVMCVHGGQADADGAQSARDCSAACRPPCCPTRGWSPAAPACRPPVPPVRHRRSGSSGTVRVTSNGQPLVIQTGVAVCAPAGTPLLPVVTQTSRGVERATVTAAPMNLAFPYAFDATGHTAHDRSARPTSAT